jgi:3-hydroxyacyl-[acyl-carrier-protein] dehydratase
MRQSISGEFVMDEKMEFVGGFEEICKLLPHRPPFLMLDRIVSIEIGKRIRAIKCMSANDPWFAGHFPGNPIMPGVLMVEAMAQASGVLYFRTFIEQGVKVQNKCILASIDGVKFRKPVVPGDVVEYDVTSKRIKGSFAFFAGQASVNGEVVAEAKFCARFYREE